jgi:ribosomal protein L7/L12
VIEQTAIWLIVAVVVGFVLGRLSKSSPEGSLMRMDRKLTMLTEHFKLKWDPTVGVPEEVLAQVRAGNKVEAIKLYRDLTGSGLRESHELIDEIDKRIRFRL